MEPTDLAAADLVAAARAIIEDNRYLTLATADGDGQPWASPVWYAHDDYGSLLWASKPDARHSRNLAVRPQLGIVIFDSTVAIGAAQAVYVEAVAEEVSEDQCEQALAVYSDRSVADGVGPWSVADVTAPARHRLYRATAMQYYWLDTHDQRIPITLVAND